MKKNVAGQKIGAQMCSATDGSAFTGSVTVYVTGDAGTQAAGSVGAGACTHEGNGYHTYAPAQAETNYDLIAFTFIGTGAIPTSLQVYTTFPQTGDAYAETTSGTYGLSVIENLVDGIESTLGTPAGASVSADIAAVQSDTNDIQTRIPAALVAGRIDASVGAMAANVVTASAVATDAVAEIQSGLSTLDAAGVRTAVGLATANLDTQLSTIDGVADSILVETLTHPTLAEVEASTALAMSAALAAVDTVVDQLNLGIIYGAAATGTLSTTQATTNLTGYTDDQLIGRTIIVTSGAAEGEGSDITDYAATGGLITFTAMTLAMANGDTFKIV